MKPASENPFERSASDQSELLNLGNRQDKNLSPKAMETQVKESLILLLNGIKRSDGGTVAAEMAKLDAMLAAGRDSLPAQLRHFLERRKVDFVDELAMQPDFGVKQLIAGQRIAPGCRRRNSFRPFREYERRLGLVGNGWRLRRRG